MTRFELMQRISSLEFSAWIALQNVRADEAQYARDLAESGDGIVTGDPTLVDDEDDELPLEDQLAEIALEEDCRVDDDGKTERQHGDRWTDPRTP